MKLENWNAIFDAIGNKQGVSHKGSFFKWKYDGELDTRVKDENCFCIIGALESDEFAFHDSYYDKNGMTCSNVSNDGEGADQKLDKLLVENGMMEKHDHWYRDIAIEWDDFIEAGNDFQSELSKFRTMITEKFQNQSSEESVGHGVQ